MRIRAREWIGTIVVALALSALSANAAELNEETQVVRARAYIALADELYREAQRVSDTLVDLFEGKVIEIPESPETAGFSFEEFEIALIERRAALVEEAEASYERLFASDFGVVGAEAFRLPINYKFLKREAYDKWVSIREGFTFGAHRVRGANLYAVNADFKKDLLERTAQIVDEVLRLDQESRRLRQQLTDFRLAQVSAEGELIGLEETRLQTQNYSLDVQTQVRQYRGEVDSLDKQSIEENKEVEAKLAILGPARQMLARNWTNLMNERTTTSGSNVHQVQASWDDLTARANPVPGDIRPGSYLYVKASGQWTPKGIARGGILRPITSTRAMRYFERTKAKWGEATQPIARKELTKFDKQIIDALKVGKLLAGPDGFQVSDNETVSKVKTKTNTETSSSPSVSVSIPFLPISVSSGGGSSTSSSSSSSRGREQGISVEFRSANTYLPEAPVGGLIAVITWPGLLPEEELLQYVGFSDVIKVPTIAEGAPATGIQVFFLANDWDGKIDGEGTGFLNVETTQNVAFETFAGAFSDWLDRGCDTNADGTEVENCGFQAILDKIAFQRDPQAFGRAAVNMFMQHAGIGPSNAFRPILTEVVEASVSLEVANRDLDMAVHRTEQTAISAMTAKGNLEDSQRKVQNTAELVETILRRQELMTKKRAPLLAAGLRFYEDELAALEALRAHALARLNRYMANTIDSFNYLYLTDFSLQGEALPGFDGQFYKEHLDLLTDQVLNIDVQEDLLNPNRGFITYDLTPAQVQEIKDTAQTAFTLRAEDFFCKGFGIEDQVRVHIEKVGFLLDVNAADEPDFFVNPNVRRMSIRTTHANSNHHWDLDGERVEYYLPSQTKEIHAYPLRVMSDVNSDFIELGLSNLFSRASFRNTSYETSWILQVLDGENFNLDFLNGVKFVVYFSSTEARGGLILQTCPVTAPLTSTIQAGKWF
ncbi:MAG: hypothetical protein IT285_13860 [Bdellovibrionales bacterium]|nr:hypothetical protein [Bdellovibrionales bacterium]